MVAGSASAALEKPRPNPVWAPKYGPVQSNTGSGCGALSGMSAARVWSGNIASASPKTRVRATVALGGRVLFNGGPHLGAALGPAGTELTFDHAGKQPLRPTPSHNASEGVRFATIVATNSQLQEWQDRMGRVKASHGDDGCDRLSVEQRSAEQNAATTSASVS